jgi:hypothetical protein
MYNTHMKSLLKYPLELDINNICTLDGYKGGDVLKISTKSRETLALVKKFCHKLEIDTNVKIDKIEPKLLHIFCEFGNDIEIYNIPESDGIYDLA